MAAGIDPKTTVLTSTRLTPLHDGERALESGIGIATVRNRLTAVTLWSGVLTSTSLQMCYALIGANWVVYGSIAEILKSNWAMASLGCILLALGVKMTVATVMTELDRLRYKYAEVKVEQWEAEFKAHSTKPEAWPFTKAIERVGLQADS